MYICENCGNKIQIDKKKDHEFQECKGFKGLDLLVKIQFLQWIYLMN